MKLLITGGAGFIGSNFVRYLLKHYSHYQIINLDYLTYAGNLDNLQEIQSHPNYRFVRGAIYDKKLVNSLLSGETDGLFADNSPVDVIVNFAAESHVDRSITDPDMFVRTNIKGTHVLLEMAKKHRVKKYLQISTDEVYGSLGDSGFFTEETPLAPNSPYSASKAAADLLVRSYHHTYGMHVNITRCSNNYGPYHFPEKLIPLCITNAIQNKELPVYGDGLHVRDWLHVEDHCTAIDLVMHKGLSGEVYNVGGNNERTNLEVVRHILSYLNKSERLIRFVEDRPGHDRRYAIDSTKLRTELGWSPGYSFETGLEQTIQWYLRNQDWWQRIKSGEYLLYYQKQYGQRLDSNIH